MQVVRHAVEVALHWNPLHGWLENVWQVFEVPTQRGSGVKFPSEQKGTPHEVSAGRNASVGQSAVLPVHDSATSHTPAAARQVVVAGENWFVGHVAEEPVQVSATSHTPALGRHTVVPLANASGGHAALVPVQRSAGSQVPFPARHTVVFGKKTSAGHAAEFPVHVSAESQPPVAAARHTVVFERKPHTPVPAAQTSHAPEHADPQHTPPAQKPD